MNSDNVTSDGLSPVDSSQETPQEQEAPKRRSSRRSTRGTAANAAAQETTDAAPAEETAPPARTRRSRRAPAAAQQGDNTPAPVVTGEEAGAESLRAEVTPLSAQGALVSEGVVGDGAAGEAPATRSRRRRGRSTRETTPEAEPLAGALEEPAPAPPVVAADEGATPVAATDEESQGQDDETAGAEAPATAPGRRSRRRGRGRGRGETPVAAESHEAQGDEEQAEAVEAATATDVETAIAVSGPDETATVEERGESAMLSPAVLRRFDHRDWRVRGNRAAPAVSMGHTPQHAPAAPAARDTGDRPSRHRRFGERRDERTRGGEAAAAEPRVSEEIETPSLAPTPIVATPAPSVAARASGPIIMPERDAGLSVVPATGGQRGSGDRVEQLIASQAALLQQQQQTLQSLASTIARLERTMERLSSGGITAGMPRAGMFVDAPNIIYAAENARINLDYGRMLDFLSRGREMVHAIVYAPVTEDTGHRMESQRFVAPFLQKGYKLVTKPLKRFPDGTAKGNFDIELAIDIVTMSQRLDVVILISGDSDFSRLIELIQSRGVRVEVVAFASNVSWELVQMADVFIDVGQYLHEFQ